MLFGQPILKIRGIVRYAMQHLVSEKKEFIVQEIAKILNCSTPVAGEVLDRMLQEKFLILTEEFLWGKTHYGIVESESARRLGVTKANPPISRAKANMLLSELLERVKEINSLPELAYSVKSVKVFGSFLLNKEILGDLDVAIELKPKCTGKEFEAITTQRIEQAFNNG